MTDLVRDHRISDLDGEERKLDAVRTFYPFRDGAPDGPQAGEIVGVLEITQDVTAALADARSGMVRLAVLGSIGLGTLLLALLVLIIRKADRNIALDFRWLLRQRKDLQDERDDKMRSAKLAGIGQLVASVAHELNNPLTSIRGLAQLMKERDDRDLDPRLQRELSMIHREAERSVKIVQNLLSFSRAEGAEGAEGAEKAYTSINSAVEAALELRRYELLVNNIHLQVDLQPDLPRTMADPHKIQQVMLNLIINAEQAIFEASDSGTLVVKSGKVGESIQVVVGDDGPGIPEENLGRLFEPFFTTKPAGTGTGLGLSICNSIVREHRGTIRVESELGKGATFLIEVPIVGSERFAGPANFWQRARTLGQRDAVRAP